jgi:hypothetical protein
MDVDHRNGDGLDNQRANLRICTHSQNMYNAKKRSTNTTGFKGVYRSRTKHIVRFRAQIQIHRKQIYLGSYSSLEDAARAYDNKAREIYGEFANTNFKD